MARKVDYTSIVNKIKEEESKKGYNNDDENEYKLKYKEDDTAGAIVRYLPPHLDESLPFIKKYNHAKQTIPILHLTELFI